MDERQNSFEQSWPEHSAPGEASACNVDGDDLVITADLSDTAPEAEVYLADLSDREQDAPAPSRRRVRPRRRMLPLTLFLLTCVSTFFVGATQWVPGYYLYACLEAPSLMPIRRALISHWEDGLIYMACVLAILLTHEMGHFLATIRYGVPASYPYFLPLPISPIGTMGAVIGMDGTRANRREMFDIGIAGPLAGLIVAFPIMWIGATKIDFTQAAAGPFQLDIPLAVRLFFDVLRPTGYEAGQAIAHGHINPWFMAGWVGLLVTGLNMMPVGQLDGGHITYALFRRRAHWIARIFMAITVILMIMTFVTRDLALMVGLVLFVMGTDHPPTSNDQVRLGWVRTVLGFASLTIPFLCFAPKLIILPK